MVVDKFFINSGLDKIKSTKFNPLSRKTVCARTKKSVTSLRAKRSNLNTKTEISDCIVIAFLAKTVLSDSLENGNSKLISTEWILNQVWNEEE